MVFFQNLRRTFICFLKLLQEITFVIIKLIHMNKSSVQADRILTQFQWHETLRRITWLLSSMCFQNCTLGFECEAMLAV